MSLSACDRAKREPSQSDHARSRLFSPKATRRRRPRHAIATQTENNVPISQEYPIPFRLVDPRDVITREATVIDTALAAVVTNRDLSEPMTVKMKRTTPYSIMATPLRASRRNRLPAPER